MDMIAGCMCDLEGRETEMCVTERGKEGEWEAAGMVRGSVIEENSRWKGCLGYMGLKRQEREIERGWRWVVVRAMATNVW